jgi:23S rRNA (adenine2503-C2)-methyltransferase
MEIQNSKLDSSVNIIEQKEIGYTEARYVRRSSEYISAYLSSQTGCNQMCQFCHLTTTNQRRYEDVSLGSFYDQAVEVLHAYKRHQIKESLPSAKYVNWNFMARGEPLNSDIFLYKNEQVFKEIGDLTVAHSLSSRFNVSTIMPVSLETPLINVFPLITPTIYYSLYSVNEEWRKKWLPSAMPVRKALKMLKDYQALTKKTVKIHSAFIHDENDDPNDILEIAWAIKDFDLNVEFNIVRYNSPNNQSRESENLSLIESTLSSSHIPVKIKERIGIDVYASCGTFYNH